MAKGGYLMPALARLEIELDCVPLTEANRAMLISSLKDIIAYYEGWQDQKKKHVFVHYIDTPQLYIASPPKPIQHYRVACGTQETGVEWIT